MPVFHTKTIESILDPVAQQVSRLVIIHEEGEAGHEMPDLVRPVHAVSKAVHNLVKVGREMVISTDDVVLKQDMPSALTKVEEAAGLLEDAASISQIDPFSKLARSKLIEGSRLILQGTSNVLMVFDESEVRKIVKECKKVLDYLSVTEVIESMEDLVQFVKDLSPCLSKVTFDVEKRIEDLTHQVHRECLAKCVEQVKTLAPILICSMKIFIQILVNGGKGTDEAGENRNYLAGRMSEEISEIVRVLQLTTYDEDEWDSDNLTVMRKTQAAIESKIQASRDWIRDPCAGVAGGSLGEKSVRHILELANKVADRSLPGDAEHVRKLSGDIRSMTDALCELRSLGQGATPHAESLAKNIDSRMNELSTTISQAINRVEKSGIQQPAPTITGKLEQARRWLEQPEIEDRGLGQQAIKLILEEARKLADILPPDQRDKVRSLCIETEDDIHDLKDLCQSGYGGSSRGHDLARGVAAKLDSLKEAILSVLVDRVVTDFMDITTPLKKFTDCVQNPPSSSTQRDQIYAEKSEKLSRSAENIGKTAKMVAVGNDSGNKKLAEGLLASASQVESLTPQLINAGRIRMVYPENAASKEHFENLRKQYSESVDRARALCDDAVDSVDFVARSLQAMDIHSRHCDSHVGDKNSLGLVEEASAVARLANRVMQVARQEAENSEDYRFTSTLNVSAEQLQSRLQTMLQSAKYLSLNMYDDSAVQDWRVQNHKLLESVKGVQGAISYEDCPPLPPYPDMSDLNISEDPNGLPRQQRSNLQEQLKVVNQTTNVEMVEKKQTPPEFTDDELSNIFQINFNEIFGSPESALPVSQYKGISLPDKGRVKHQNFELEKNKLKQKLRRSKSAVTSNNTSPLQKQYARKSKEFESIPLPPPQFNDDYQRSIKANILEKANRPVKASNRQDSADRLIQELMEEVEKDEKLKELAGIPPTPPPPPKYVPRPYRTAAQIAQRSSSLREHNSRSRSADGRLSSSYNKEDNFRGGIERTLSSDDNFKGELMNEVVKEHHSVKDLVKMIERNTKSESANPYVRKWGCDLISPEPRSKKSISLRREKRECGSQPVNKKIYNWKNDDYFKHKHRVIEDDDTFIDGHTNEDEDVLLEGNFRLSSHIADMDDLLCGIKQEELSEEIPDIVVSHDAESLPPPPSPPSLLQIDEEIASLQNQFETDLNTLILDSKKRSASKTKECGNGIKPKFLKVDNQQQQTLSDDEGTYAALSVVFQDTSLSDTCDRNAPPRPPLPREDDFYGASRSNGISRVVHPDTTDDESEDFFLNAPTPSQGPIMLAAHDLHQEVKQWSSKDNDIIAAAKKMAHLMAKLSQLVGEDAGSKRELISCAKSIAEASDDVTRIAKELAKECTDKRMRTNLLQVCERIPTIATQLKILSTVKATMLGAQCNRGTDEDLEATDMLVGNAQNLMQSVKHTVTVAEAASIKIRTDAGIRLKWTRKQPWYQY